MSAERITELRDLLNRANHEYHVLGDAKTLSDAQYDELLRELIQLEAKHPAMADPDSPSCRVGGQSQSGFAKVKHGRKMLSLDNVYSADETWAFFGEKTITLAQEPKIDGLSVKLVYVEGKLIQATTRGDGAVGDDVTANVKTIRSVPLVLRSPATLEVNGEVFMTFTAFEAANKRAVEAGDEPFANPRNAAAGTLKLKDAAEVAARKLSFVAHGSPTQITGVKRHSTLTTTFENLGFMSVRMLPMRTRTLPVAQTLVVDSPKALEAAITEADTRRKKLDLPTDGLVYKIDDLAVQRELGEGTKSPRWAAAYKFPPERKQTTLERVVLQVGRTGKITPVAEVTPVDLSGTTVSRASLCNQDEINRLGCHVGSTVLIEKSAEIIPKIVGVIPSKSGVTPFKFPSKCPCCNEPLRTFEGLVDIFCTNAYCPDQVFQQLVYATGKGALDIDGCGDVLIQHLIQLGVTNLYELLTVKELGNMKPAARVKFVTGQAKALTAPLWRKIAALGIEGIGKSRAQDLAARFPNLTEAMPEKIETVIGPAATKAFFDYVDKHALMIHDLAQIGFVLSEDAQALGVLSGKIFVITGALLSGTRDSVIRKIEAAGGTVKSSVSAKVTYLVAGDDCGAKKSADAKRLGVKVITEDELYAMLGVPMEIASGSAEEE